MKQKYKYIGNRYVLIDKKFIVFGMPRRAHIRNECYQGLMRTGVAKVDPTLWDEIEDLVSKEASAEGLHLHKRLISTIKLIYWIRIKKVPFYHIGKQYDKSIKRYLKWIFESCYIIDSIQSMIVNIKIVRWMQKNSRDF